MYAMFARVTTDCKLFDFLLLSLNASSQFYLLALHAILPEKRQISNLKAFNYSMYRNEQHVFGVRSSHLLFPVFENYSLFICMHKSITFSRNNHFFQHNVTERGSSFSSVLLAVRYKSKKYIKSTVFNQDVPQLCDLHFKKNIFRLVNVAHQKRMNKYSKNICFSVDWVTDMLSAVTNVLSMQNHLCACINMCGHISLVCFLNDSNSYFDLMLKIRM